MSNQSGTPEKTSTAAKIAARKPRPLTPGLALISAIIALLISGYLWYMLEEKQELFDSDVNGRLERLENSTGVLQENVTLIDQNLTETQETQEALKGAMEKISTDLGQNRLEWVLAETEQLLLIANHRLELAHDTELALAALRAADRNLRRVTSPAVLPLRRILAEEIRQLESVEPLDIPGLTLQLGTIASKIDRLPLAVETRFRKTETPETQAAVEAEEPGAWSGFLREMWQDLRNLVRVRADAPPPRPLLPPEQHYFLRENLRLMVYGAQIALLQRDETTFHQNVRTAQQWIKDHFDPSAKAVIKIQNDLDAMSNMRVRQETPDISASLDALHKLGAKRGTP